MKHLNTIKKLKIHKIIQSSSWRATIFVLRDQSSVKLWLVLAKASSTKTFLKIIYTIFFFKLFYLSSDFVCEELSFRTSNARLHDSKLCGNICMLRTVLPIFQSSIFEWQPTRWAIKYSPNLQTTFWSFYPLMYTASTYFKQTSLI